MFRYPSEAPPLCHSERKRRICCFVSFVPIKGSPPILQSRRPYWVQQVQQVPLTLTSATEEERLNQMASPQKVYVVYSDIEGAGRQVDVVQHESTF